MNEFISGIPQEVWTQLIGHIMEIFFLLASVLVAYLVSYIKRKTSAEQRLLAESLIRSAVLYVQQTMPDMDPNAKLQLALEQAAVMLNDKGIKIDDTAILIMIEAQIKELKKQFGEDWYSPPIE